MQKVMGLQQAVLDASIGVSATVDLRIMETTDLHMHLHPYDYYSDTPDPGLGLTRLAGLIDIARQEVPNSLLFDNGDFLQGTPVGDFIAFERGLRAGDLHPITEAMNALRYDAITLGNHEFNYGLDFLTKAMSQAEFPVVAANILTQAGPSPRKDRHYARPYTLLRRKVTDRAGRSYPLCIGVIGVAPPQITVWERQALGGLIQTRDMVETVRAFVPEMREAGADLVVLLAHSGIGPIRHSENMENAIIPLAGIEGVDLILSGHSHQLFPSRLFANIPGIDVERGTICGKPVVMSGFFGSHLGLIDLKMLHTGGRWMVLTAEVTTRCLRDTPAGANRPALLTDTSCAQIPRMPRVRKIVERTHLEVIENNRQPIGRCAAPINSFFVYLGQTAATALIADAQAEFVARHIHAPELTELPLLSAVAPCKAGGLAGPRNFSNVQAGTLTLRALGDLYLYPNTIAACRVTGADLLLWLERSASAYNQIYPDLAEQFLMDATFPSYNFEIVYGLDYEIDLSAPARFTADGQEIDPRHARIRNLTWQGRPLDPAAEFLLCTNSFRAQGAGGFAGTGPENVVFEDPTSTREVLRDYIARHDVVPVRDAGPFRLQPVRAATAILRTSVAAHAHLDAVAERDPESLGIDAQGFMRLRVSL
ncbi:MAG: bifunctional 2',3'-cyclic-nucleotide 2'-phosphodiesterase/3'-nucleotidase [Rhodobacteraceae bacterium]|nr:MAG: bifunctional 2',3'-cyclic-nucleotide 2'-phosphodiesterase/3'-nucleotidase [Paracoccaceae bacterium]